MRIAVKAWALEGLAVILALLQWQVGVRTDEAKYLLNIPYPHPPAVRFILGLTKGFPFQELLWRLVFATLLLQAVWLVWDLTKGYTKNQRTIIALAWIFSSAILLQAGTVMMAPLTALEALAFLWLSSRPALVDRYRGFVALFWLFSLFTAYQAVLFAPIVFLLFWRLKAPLLERAAYALIPLLLLSLYTLGNPLAAASFGVHAGRQIGESSLERIAGYLKVWLLGGSAVGSVAGTIGLLRLRRADLLLSFLLVSAYVLLSRYDYYAVLFAPLFAVGFTGFFDPRCATAPWFERPVWISFFALGAWATIWFCPLPGASLARQVMRDVAASGMRGTVLISGSFGHEWQYESPAAVRRFAPELVAGAGAVICLDACPPFDKTGWTPVTAAREAWVSVSTDRR